MKPALSLDTIPDTMPQMIDLLTTGIHRSFRSQAQSQKDDEDGTDGFFFRKIPSLGQALNLFIVTSLVTSLGPVGK